MRKLEPTKCPSSPSSLLPSAFDKTSKASFIESHTLTKTSTSTLSAGVCCITLLSPSLHTAEVTTKARDCSTCNGLGSEVQCPYTRLNCTIPPVNPISEPKVGPSPARLPESTKGIVSNPQRINLTIKKYINSGGARL